MGRTALVAAACIAGGFALGQLAPSFVGGAPLSPHSGANVERQVELRPIERIDLVDPKAREAAAPEVATERVQERERVRSPEAPLFSTALLSRHHSEFARGWREHRTDEPSAAIVEESERMFRDRTLALSAQLGAAAAIASTKAEGVVEALRSNDSVELVRAFQEGAWRPASDFVAKEEFEALTRARGTGGAIDGESFQPGKATPLAAGATISFGPGIHKLRSEHLRGEDGSLPRDVTIVGAGRDATLLRFGDYGTGGIIERLTFRDVTLDAQNDGLFDHRSGGAAVHLERARVVRFDAGHGGCTVFSFRGGFFVTAIDVEFAGGYGKSPGHGRLGRDGPALGRFVRCQFDRIEVRWLRSLRGGALRFEGCSFRLTGEDPREHAGESVQFAGCTYEQLEDDRERLRRDLNDLFPGAG